MGEKEDQADEKMTGVDERISYGKGRAMIICYSAIWKYLIYLFCSQSRRIRMAMVE